MSPPSESTSSRAASRSIFDFAGGAIFLYPANGVAFFDAAQFDDRAIPAESFTNALVAFFVGEVHAAGVDGNADVVGDEDQYRVGIGIATVLLDGVEFFFVRSAAEKGFDAAHEKDLKRRHERGSSGAVKNFRQIGFREIKFEETEFPQIRWNQVLQNRVAAFFAEKYFVSHKNICRTQLLAFHFGDETLGLGEGAH